MKRAWTLLAAALTCGAEPALAEQTLCDALHQFEVAPHAQTAVAPKRRSITFYWGTDPAEFFSVGCLHSTEAVEKQTCEWLIHHTSWEFPMGLAQGVMRCHGYLFPKGAILDWHAMSGTIRLPGSAGEDLILDLAFDTDKSAIRLSVEQYGIVYMPAEPKALEPWPATPAK